MLNPLDYLFDRAFALLPNWLQWAVLAVFGGLIAALVIWLYLTD